MTIAKKIDSFMSKSSWIRKMFEEGARLKAEHGAENVFDFSLGNPNLPPPEKFSHALNDTVASISTGDHGYMANIGYPNVREAIADFLTTEQGVTLSGEEIIMTCGAAGALNVILKAILDPDDEVITPSPFFVEYTFYADNHGGVLKTAPTTEDFNLDIDAIADAVTPATKAVLINSPHNPTGQIYSAESLDALAQVLTEKGRELNRTIYLISDEPYRKIVYDGAVVPSIFKCYSESIVTSSYSKDLSIPGERLGFIAVNPEAAYKKDLLSAMALTNRVLGFVNAPALMQRVVAAVQGESVDVGFYARNRDIFCEGLAEAGYDLVKPPGAFYLFPKSPIKDDVEFVRALQEELILAVPGSGFGRPGHFRLAYCVENNTIKKALPGFKRVMEKLA
jgi:aspartate aminotransferase